MMDGSEVIGSVPVHLRHLHNLLIDLLDEIDEVERAFRSRTQRLEAVRSIFFDALKTYVPESENAKGVQILENWDVAAYFRSDKDNGRMAAVGEFLAMTVAGGRR